VNTFRTHLNVFTPRKFEILYNLQINIIAVLNSVCSPRSVYYFIYTALIVDEGTKIRKNIKQFNNNIVLYNFIINTTGYS